MRKILLMALLLGVIFSIGCIEQITKRIKEEPERYILSNVYAENPNIDFGKNTRIFFEVANNADTTLVPKIEVQVNETCFSRPSPIELDKIAPGGKIRSYVYLQTTSTYPYRTEDRSKCIGKPFPVTLFLEDINGKVLDKVSIEIGIV